MKEIATIMFSPSHLIVGTNNAHARLPRYKRYIYYKAVYSSCLCVCVCVCVWRPSQSCGSIFRRLLHMCGMGDLYPRPGCHVREEHCWNKLSVLFRGLQSCVDGILEFCELCTTLNLSLIIAYLTCSVKRV